MEELDFKFDKEASLTAEKVMAEAQEMQNKDFTYVKSDDETSDVQNSAKDDGKEEAKEEAKEEEKKVNDKTQGQSSLGKFKNPEELLKAYVELEKEFTRRSQRLKEFEKSAAPYVSEEEWREAADKFFSKTPSAKALAREMAQEIALDPTLKEGKDCFDKALLRALVKCYRTPEQLMSDGQFLKDYVLSSDAVREAVIQSYLREVREGEPPLTLSSGGQSSAAPSKKPRSVKEAGDMLLRENK